MDDITVVGKAANGEEAFTQAAPREKEVLILVAQGTSIPDVARELGRSEATVRTHLANLMKKLEVREKAQAVIAAYQSGLVQV